MLKKIMKKEEGFTLAELLIVVAIIAVLVAVSIPIFTSQLEKSREATDMANMRAAKAAIVTAYLSEEAPIYDKVNQQYKSGKFYYDAAKGLILQSATDILPYGKGTQQIPSGADPDEKMYPLVFSTTDASGTTTTSNGYYMHHH